jgi:hypothetical protein
VSRACHSSKRDADLPPLGLSNVHNCTRATVTLAPNGRLFVLKRPCPPPPTSNTRKRGKVVQFSPQSRKRLMQLFASIDTDYILRAGLFLTLTYEDPYPTDPKTWKANLRAFITALEREFPTCATVWRMEYQERGAPHFHLITFGPQFIDKEWITATWRRIALSQSRYQGHYATKIERPSNCDQACYYLTKYAAKVDKHAKPIAAGRLWGVRRGDLLPITLLEATIDVEGAQRLKEGMIGTMDPDSVNKCVKVGRGGVWTMFDGRDALIMSNQASLYGLTWRPVLPDYPEGLPGEEPTEVT